jgi:hypothetical protein
MKMYQFGLCTTIQKIISHTNNGADIRIHITFEEVAVRESPQEEQFKLAPRNESEFSTKTASFTTSALPAKPKLSSVTLEKFEKCLSGPKSVRNKMR